MGNSPAETAWPMKVPERLALLLMGHAAFQFLYAGAELGLFTFLARSAGASPAQIGAALGLADRPTRGLLLGACALRLVERRPDGGYANHPEMAALVEGPWWEAFVATLRFEALIVYPGQGRLVESLRRDDNAGLDAIPGAGADLYHRLAESPAHSKVFFEYMSSWSRIGNPCLLRGFDFAGARRVLDVGGGDATNAIALAQAHPHLSVTLLDIPSVCELAERRVREAGLGDRVRVLGGDALSGDFPSGHDCILFVHLMVIWPAEVCRGLLVRAHRALPPGGRVVIFNSVSSDSGDGPLVAALDNAYFLTIPSRQGFIHARRDYDAWLADAGFVNVSCTPCTGWTPHMIIAATKR